MTPDEFLTKFDSKEEFDCDELEAAVETFKVFNEYPDSIEDMGIETVISFLQVGDRAFTLRWGKPFDALEGTWYYTNIFEHQPEEVDPTTCSPL